MKNLSEKFALWSGLLLCAASSTTALAASSIITFTVDMSVQVTNVPQQFFPTNQVFAKGSFNGWGNLLLTNNPLAPDLASNIFSGTVNDTADANGTVVSYKFGIGSAYEGTWDFNNRAAYLPATSGGSLVLPTAYYNDAGPMAAPITVTFRVDMSEQIFLGKFSPSMELDVKGKFNGWAGGATILSNDPTLFTISPTGIHTNQVYTNTVTFAMPIGAVNDFKYYYNNGVDQWDQPAATNSETKNVGDNRFHSNASQVLPIVYFSDLALSTTITNAITFRVDMSVQTNMNAFNQLGDVVYGEGDFNGWAQGFQLTNNPTGSNPNLYSGTTNVVAPKGSLMQYKFYSTDPGQQTVHGGYESPASMGGNNRTLALPTDGSAVTLPLVYWGDTQPNDVLPADTQVTFTVDMTGAMDNTGTIAFDPASHSVHLNGDFLGSTLGSPATYGWLNWNALAPMPQLQAVGTSLVYTNTITIPKGTPVVLNYLFTFDPSQAFNEGPGGGQNHVRYVRNTGLTPYVLNSEHFGSPYTEPSFGFLKVGAAAANHVEVSWLGRPGVNLQSKASVASGSWVDLPQTDGGSWITGPGYNVNGFFSGTNYSTATSPTFFRLIHPGQTPSP